MKTGQWGAVKEQNQITISEVKGSSGKLALYTHHVRKEKEGISMSK